MLISTLVDYDSVQAEPRVWQYMLISTLVDELTKCSFAPVWQYMLISTLVDFWIYRLVNTSDSIC